VQDQSRIVIDDATDEVEMIGIVRTVVAGAAVAVQGEREAARRPDAGA